MMLYILLGAFIAAITIFQFIVFWREHKFKWKYWFFLIVLIVLCAGIYFHENAKKSIDAKPTEPDISISENTSQNPSNPLAENEPSKIPSNDDENQSPASPSDESLDNHINDEEQENSEIGKPFVEVSPQNQITNANLYAWNENNDRDIIGNTYPAAMKLCVSNMIDAMFGNGQSDIVADVHIPFGAKADEIWRFSFVAAQDMVGNGSSASVTIYADEVELYPAFTLTSSTTEDLTYEINLTGIRDLVFHFECISVGSGFCAGIVLDDNVE